MVQALLAILDSPLNKAGRIKVGELFGTCRGNRGAEIVIRDLSWRTVSIPHLRSELFLVLRRLCTCTPPGTCS